MQNTTLHENKIEAISKSEVKKIKSDCQGYVSFNKNTYHQRTLLLQRKLLNTKYYVHIEKSMTPEIVK